MVHFFSSVMFMLIFLFVIVGLFSSPLSFPCLTRESVKAIFGSSPNMTGKSSRMTEEKIILSLPDLIRQSTNTRHLLTICTQKATRFDKVSCRSRCCGQAGYSLSFPCLAREYKRDVRVKPEYDKEKSPLV